MVKKWVVVSVLSILLVVGCIIEYNFVNNSFDYLHKELEEFKPQIQENKENINLEENVVFIENLHIEWQKKVKGLKSLIWHTGIKDIEIGLARIKVYTQENDYTETLAELEALIDYVQHYKEDFTISIENLL